MRHYEVVLIIHPDQSSKVSLMIDKYKEIVENGNGNIHRLEDWGRRHLSYPINKIYKAHYILMNIECSQDVLKKLTHNFCFNDAVLRNLVVSCKQAISKPSVMIEGNENK